jgi:hypothetical protein
MMIIGVANIRKRAQPSDFFFLRLSLNSLSLLLLLFSFPARPVCFSS